MRQPLRFGSVCSGIEGASEAWYPLGMQCAWTAEIEPFPAAVIAERWGHKNYGDFREIGADAEPIDLLVGGTPCQDFSVAGLRAGMAGDRGNLTLEFLRLAQRTRPRWVVWENVPGVLSSNNGRDFGTFLRGLGELGYGFAYRILDAQHFGVPQRRRRVFVVGYFGDWRVAAAVLFERHSLSGNPAPSRKAGERVTPSVAARLGDGGYGHDFDTGGGLVNISPAVTSKWHKGSGGPAGDECQNLVTHSLRADGFDASEDGEKGLVVGFAQNQRDEVRLMDVAGALAAEPGAKQQTYVHAFSAGQSEGSGSLGYHQEQSPTLRGASSGTNQVPAMMRGMAVRRLTPRECERLQGFQDDYTLIKFRGKPAADGNRYKALGNSWAVPVVRWIGNRILTSISESAGQTDFRDTTKK